MPAQTPQPIPTLYRHAKGRVFIIFMSTSVETLIVLAAQKDIQDDKMFTIWHEEYVNTPVSVSILLNMLLH